MGRNRRKVVLSVIVFVAVCGATVHPVFAARRDRLPSALVQTRQIAPRLLAQYFGTSAQACRAWAMFWRCFSDS